MDGELLTLVARSLGTLVDQIESGKSHHRAIRRHGQAQRALLAYVQDHPECPLYGSQEFFERAGYHFDYDAMRKFEAFAFDQQPPDQAQGWVGMHLH